MGTERPAYRPHEAWMIQLLTQLFKKAKLRVDDHPKVGKLPLEIDLVAIVGKKRSFVKLPQLFHYFRRYNIMEVKSEKDRFGIGDLQKLQAYGWLYMAKHAVVSPKDVTLTALVHHLTPTVLEALPEYDFEPVGKGVFCRHSPPISYVISIEDAPDELLPEELQAFSNSQRRMRALLAALQKRGQSPIVEAIFNLYESEVDQLMANEALAKKLVKIAGPKRVAAALDKKYLLEALSQDDIIAAVLRNKRLLKTLKTKLKLQQRRKMSGEPVTN